MAVLAAGVGCAGGPNPVNVKGFIDPTEMFPNSATPLQKPILTSLSALDPSIDDPEDEFYNAQDITPQDTQVLTRDYRIGKGDLVNVSVSGLVEQNLETVKQNTVSESGNINLPLIPPVKAEGLTEAELQRAIAAAYRDANILSSAQVSAQVVEARARSFSILGAVNAPSQYIILKSDFRVLDALVLAHDTLPSVDTVYIVRQVKEDPNNLPPDPTPTPGTATPPPAGAPAGPAVAPGADPFAAPRGDAGPARGGVMSAMIQATSGPSLTPALDPATPTGGGTPAVPATPAAPAPATPMPANPMPANPMPVAPVPAAPPPPVPSPAAGTATPFQFSASAPPSMTRTIRVPLTALRAGDLTQNIVIRPGDLILAPQPVVGEYYMGGHVARTGVYSLSARKITIKQAVISAGMFDGLAIPQRTEIYRRIGAAREALVRVDVDAIFSGAQPDIFLKPNDVVQVGTNILAPFIAAIRGGFRITYGFGFLYDRNFAPVNNEGI